MTRLIIAAILCFSSMICSADVIKKSKSGICHAPDSQWYGRTQNYKSYNSLDECLQSGGRLPKGYTPKRTTKDADKPAQQTNNYEREKFGSGWSDDDRDCQNTRHEVLGEQSTIKPTYNTDGCQILRGRWVSMFTGKVIFDASEIDIDHVVPLKWAWDHGAAAWDADQRIKFANDTRNLIAVEASLNRQKGASGIDQWLPPENQCQYILRFYRVVKTYSLNYPETYENIISGCR